MKLHKSNNLQKTENSVIILAIHPYADSKLREVFHSNIVLKKRGTWEVILKP